ncbi:MAG: cytochrome P450 [Caulobacterales bacterium]
MTKAAALSLEGFQPFDPAELSSPHEGWAMLRRQSPLYRIEMPRIPNPVYLVTKREDIVHIEYHPEIFSHKPAPAIWRWGDFEDKEIADVFAKAGFHIVQALQTSDPPLAAKHRKLLDDAMSFHEVGHLKSEIAALIDSLIAKIPSGEPVDFVKTYSVPLPLLVILKLLEIPYEMHDFFHKYTDDFAILLDPIYPVDRAAKAAETIVAGYAFFEKEILRYRERPANNLMSAIANAKFDGENLASMAEALAICHNTLIAGNETTRNALSSAMFFLTQRKDIWARLTAEPDRVGEFVEEVLRMDSPSNTTPRLVTEDTELSGVKLPKGTVLFLLWGSGSRDEEKFKNAAEFDLDRNNKRAHTAFGYGARHCPGNILARAEINLSVRKWLDEFEDMEFAVPVEDIHYEPIFGFRALGRLPMRFKRRVKA